MPQEQAGALAPIDHIVVLMLENRSFDNILGLLYDPGNDRPFQHVPGGQTFNGVSGKGLSNPAGPGQPAVPTGSTTDTTNPFPDPGERYEQVYSQLYNVPAPVEAYQVPVHPPQPPPMTGFVNNYGTQKHHPTAANIMNGFRPAGLLNTCTLAQAFAVCDNWFASVPSQTFTNRSFVHAGTASGYVNNTVGLVPMFVNDTPTIYNLLEAQSVSWRVYYASDWFLSMTYLGQRQIERYMFASGPRRMFPFQSFLDDAKNGTLPSYSFVEPIFMDSKYGRENDMHPDSAILRWDGKPSDARFGDELVGTIYQALKSGPQWNSTLLVITFDEHGGTYDHVPPPATAAPPDTRIIPPNQPGYSGFLFDRYGVRVPALMVSPLLVASHVDHTLYDHTSILRAVMQRFGITGNALGNRVSNANPIAPLFASASRSDVPDLPAPAAAADDAVAGDSRLTDIQDALVHAAARRLRELNPRAIADETELTTRQRSQAELQRVAAVAGLGDH